MTTLAALERHFPEIAWREPVPLRIAGWPAWEGFACRVCIARHGLRAQEVLAGDTAHAFQTREEFDRHWQEEHGE